MRCHCGSTTSFRDGDFVYGPGYEHIQLVVCDRFPSCDSYVGVHKNTNEPLGTLADKETRRARIHVHKQLDPLWKNGTLTKTEAYNLLFKITDQKHIADMTAKQAYRAAFLIIEWKTSQKIAC